MKQVLLILFFILGITLHAYSQYETSSWNGLTFEAELSKDVQLNFETQVRLDNGFTNPYLLFFSPGIDYDIASHLRIGANYRYSLDLDKSGKSHRYTIQVELRDLIEYVHDKSRLGASFRIRGTHELFDFSRSESIVRFKLDLDYNLPNTKLRPEFSTESFFRFNEQLVYSYNEVKGLHHWDKYRFRIGASYPLRKIHQLSLFYQFQSGFISGQPGHTIGAGYKYEFKL